MSSLSPATNDRMSVSSSPLSPSTTDSDSISPSGGAKMVQTSPAPPTSKSPILIKYNYYDYNGFRQEQQNQDMNFHNNNNNHNHKSQHPYLSQQVSANGDTKIERQLSPTFKQNIDQIVRNSQQQPISHSPEEEQQQQLIHSARRYKLSSYEQRCLRCNKTVYQMDKVGPLKDFTFYHQNCFKCRACGTKLTLKTYFNNQQASRDQEVYCHRHCPKTGPGRLDNQSVGIRAALNAPKVFDPALSTTSWVGLEHQHSPHRFAQDYGAPNGRQLLLNTADSHPQPPLVNSSAMHIQHAVRQTKAHNLNRHPQVDQRLSQIISGRLEFLRPKQKMLEMRHREEEDALFKQFEAKWRQEETHISEQIREEWQLELGRLLDKYAQQLSDIHSSAAIDFHRKQQQRAAEQHQGAESGDMRSIELERMNLEKTMTIKLDRKKETLKRKLKEFERQATAELVEKQSREMLALISVKLEEYKEEQKRKIGSDLEQIEAAESLATRLDSSLQLSRGERANSTRHEQSAAKTSGQLGRSASSGARPNSGQHMEAPAPRAPQVSKMELYSSERLDEVFAHIDEIAINVAKEEQQTFTDLVHHLTRDCLSDVEKVRAIFRWVTVKNLNTMQFDSSVKPDTPLGLLRGIKNGSESYHVLFKRLCSYAGLHCVVIKGYSKSAGYQPGVKFEGNRFRNSWNAVYVAGAWRFVQCNWGARHLVSVAVMQDKNRGSAANNGLDLATDRRHTGSQQQRQQQQQPDTQVPINVGRSAQQHLKRQPANHGRRGLQQPAGESPLSSPLSSSASSASSASSRRPSPPASAASDTLRYEYDDHYFLTDPDEFIYEFFPLAPEWQLIRTRPISLAEFELLPFVRSLFFKFGLYFPQTDIRSVLHADSSGATTVRIGMPTHMIPSLIFHYNLKRLDSDAELHRGVSLKRFVMQSVESGAPNVVAFRAHLPEDGAYILDVFANATSPSEYVTGEPMKFKSVCKFKIVARGLRSVMVPLPDCASGEFGPMKATRLFGIIPISHEAGLISVQNGELRPLEIQLRMTRPLLDFMASLHKNGHDERHLSSAIRISLEADVVLIRVAFPEDGQYGLDVYTRDAQQQAPTSALPHKQLLTHCCKYLINVRGTPPPPAAQ